MIFIGTAKQQMIKNSSYNTLPHGQKRDQLLQATKTSSSSREPDSPDMNPQQNDKALACEA